MRYTPTDVTSTYAAISALNANFADIATLMEKCVFTDGTAPNSMEADFDMNHFLIHNVGDAVIDSDVPNFGQVKNIITSGFSAIPVSPKDFGAIGDGTTDDYQALQDALNTGRPVDTTGYTFAFGKRLIIPDGGGFTGRGLLLMLTGAGKFDAADYTTGYDNLIGIFVDSVSNVNLNVRVQMQANVGIRTCSAIWVRSCTNVNIVAEAWGFKEARFGIIEWNSNDGGSVFADVHDCYINSNTLATMQVTGLSVDSNRAGAYPGTNSTGLRFGVRAKNIYFGSTAITKYGYQTDAVNLQGSGSNRHSGWVNATNVHEPLDCWCDHNVVDVVAEQCLFGVKLIYGASHNVIRATVKTFMDKGVFIGGGATQATVGNRVYVTTEGGGETGGFGDVSGVMIDGTGTGTPDRNYVEITAKGDGVNLDYGALIANGATNNTIQLEATGCAIAQGLIGTSAGADNVIRRLRPSVVRANLTTNTSGYADRATIICGTETKDRYGEFNPVTGIWTATCSGTVRARIKASVSVNAGVVFGSYIMHNATSVSRQRETNGTTSGIVMAHNNVEDIEVAPGDTISFQNDGGDGTTTWFAGADSTYIEIREIS